MVGILPGAGSPVASAAARALISAFSSKVVPVSSGSGSPNSFADRASRPLQTLLLGIGLAVGIWLVFVVLLRQPIPVWPRLN
jgi:hypothetical protein